jgi:phospholipase/carboxylesterase
VPAPTATSASASASASSSANVAAGVHFVIRHIGGTTPTSEAPMVIAIHGLGDSPQRFAGLLDAVEDPARIIYPRGLSPHGRGFSWFGRGPSRADGIRTAAAKLADMIDVLTRRYATRGKPVVTGFSQGGMLSYALAVQHGDKIGAAVPIAGALPLELVPLRSPDGSPPILGLHGDADPVLPIAPTRELTLLLRERGFEANLTEYPGIQHTVSPAMHRALMRHLHEALTEGEP